MSNSNSSSTMMIMLVMGVCCCCVLSSGGILALYFMHDGFKEWVDENILKKDGDDPTGDGKKATGFLHTQFGAPGSGKDFPVGVYNTLGDFDKQMSSLKIDTGLKVTMYDNTNLTGNSIVMLPNENEYGHDNFNHWKMSDNSYHGKDQCGPDGKGCWNDKVRSLKVERA